MGNIITSEVGIVIWLILSAAYIASFIYGLVIMIPNKKIPTGAKVLFGIAFIGLPFVGPVAYKIIAKNWDNIVGNNEAK